MNSTSHGHISRALFSFLLVLSIISITVPPNVARAAITDVATIDMIASTVSILERVLGAIQGFFAGGAVAQTTSGGNQGNGGNHPYLLFTDAELVGIRAKVNDTSTINNKFWLAFKSRCDGLKSEVQNSVFPTGGFGSGYSTSRGYQDSLKVTDVAVCAAIANDASMMSAVKAALTRFSNYRPIVDTDGQIELYDVGAFSQMIIPMDIAYDSLATDLTTRNKLEDLLYAQTINVLNTTYADMSLGRSKGNHWMGYMSIVYGTGTLLKGYTRYGSGLTPAQLTAKGEAMMKYFFDKDFDPDGSEYEPYNYTQSVVISNLYLWQRILKNYSGTDLARYRVVDGKPILQRFGEYAMHVTAPDLEHAIGFGDGRDVLLSRLPYAMNAVEYNDGVAMWFWKEMDRRTVGALTTTNILREYETTDILPIALWGKEISEVRPSSAPAGEIDLVKAYDSAGSAQGQWGSGHIFMRTGFEGINDIKLASQAGDYNGFHGHSDEGAYILNAFGARFLTDTFFNTGGYDSSGYYYLQSSKAHNGVMACSSDLTECHASGYRLNSNPQIQGYSAPDAVITLNERSGNMYHVAADLGAAYRRHGEDGLTTIDPDTITDADRHFVFVRKSSSDGFYVIIDDLTSSVARRWQQRQHYSEDVTPTLPGGNKLTLTKNGTSNKVFIDAIYANQSMTMRGPTTLNCSGGGCEKSVLDRYVELTTNNSSGRFVQMTLLYPSATGVAPTVPEPVISGSSISLTVEGRTVTYNQSTKTITMSGGGTTPPAACSDGLDNDGDTKIDFGTATSNDPGCTSLTDNDEYNAPPPASPVACSPTSQSVITGQSASFTASNGNGTYAWTATGGTPSTGSGASFSTTYTSTGTKSVSVTSNSTTASCSVSVSTPPVTTTNCSDGVDGTDGEDTLIDMADPGCASPADTSESNPTPVSTKFSVGNTVRVSNTAGVNVRMPAGGASVGDGTGQPSGATGTVVEGPKFAVYSGVNYWWWNIDYTNAPDGWSIQDGLTVVTAPPPPTACADGLDNDADTKIDYGTGTNNDPGCTSLTDTDEYNPPPPASPVTCSPATQSVYTSASATFTAANGNGTYTWTATGGTPSTGSGASFSTTYSTTGTKSVSVTSNSTTASCSVSVSTPPVTGGGNNGNGGNHPYLLFTDQDLVDIRAKVNNSALVNNKYWLAFKADCDSQKSAVQNSVFPASGFGSGYSVRDGFYDAPKVRDVAICATIANDASMMSAVKAALTRFSNYSAFPNQPTASDPNLIDLHELGVFSPMVVAMDIAYDSFTTSSELSIRNRLEDLFYAEAVSVSTDYFWGDLSQPRGKGNKWYHAVGSVYGAGTLLKNYTRYGSGPTPASLITKGEAMMKYFLNYNIDPTGSEYEPYNYTQSVVTSNMYLWHHILNNYAGVDLFRYRIINGKPILQRFGEYTMHITAPNLNNAAGFGDGRDGLSKRASYAMNAAYYNDGAAMWYWNEMDRRRIGAMTTTNIRADYETDDLLTIMLWGKSIPEVRPSNAPAGELDFVRVHNAPGVDPGTRGSGQIFMRTGFEQTNDIQLVSKVGNHGGFHGHSDEGGYILNAFGVRFLTDTFFNTGGYDSSGYAYLQSSRAHNPVMACNSTLSACHSTGYQHNSNPTLQGYSPQVASITQNERVGNMYHVAGDLGEAYRRHGEFADGSIDPDTITDADRHFVFARKSNSDGFYVIIDDLASSVARRWQQRHHYSADVTPSLPGGNNLTLTKPGTTNKVFINTVYSNQAMTLRGPTTLNAAAGSEEAVLDRYVELSTNAESNRFVQVTLLYPSATGVAPVVGSPIVSGNVLRIVVDGRTVTYDMSTKTVTMSEGTTPPPPAVCADGIDNDGDGKTDYPTDPGCSSSTDTDEYNAPIAACSDGLDNDGDTKIDYGTGASNDPGCTSLTDNDEYNAPSPISPVTCSPTTQSVYTSASASFTAANGNGTYSWTATGGTPSTGTGATFSTTYSTTGTKSVSVTSNSTSASCNVSVTTPPPVAALCANSIDDDGDGKVDMADYGCVLATDNDESNPTPVSTKFAIGNAVKVTTTTFLNVRDIPGGTDIGDQLDNQNGTVIAGPKYAVFSGTPFWWWNIDFASGADGWSIQDGLTIVTAPPPACSDGLDNDGDTKIDFGTGTNNDPGCTSLTDTDEYNAPPPVYTCSDGLDNDGDGKIDLADLGCSSSTDNDEYNAPLAVCADGLDNDSDGKIDYPADFGCTSATDTSEINPVSTADIKARPSNSGTYTGGSISLNTGTTAAIQWSSTNAGSCTVVSNPSGTAWTGTAGTQTTPTLIQATTYALTCYQAGAVASTDSVVVNIVIPVACADGIDNDGDGKIDYGTATSNDPGCTSATDDSEADPVITDTTAPTISNLLADSSRGDQLVVTWTTNEPATSRVAYGTSGDLGELTEEDPRYVTSHTVTIHNLDRKTIYYVQVSSRDAAGNTRTSSIIGTYTVARLPKSPKVTELTASSGSIILRWNNPTEYEFYAGTIVMRSDTDFILTPSRATALADITGTTYTDTSAVVGTAYYYTVFTYDDEGTFSDPEFISYRILPGTITGTVGGGSVGSGGGTSDYIAPLSPTAFSAVQNGDGTATLHWVNPSDSDFSRVRILRKAGNAPTSASGADGSAIIYEGPMTAIVDGAVTVPNTFYAIFALDVHGNVSLPTVATRPSANYNSDGSEIITEGPGSAYPGVCSVTTPGITITRWLVFGEFGADVHSLQQYLNKIGHTVASSGPGAPGEESDYFGALTERALKRYQCERLGVCSGDPTTTGHGGVGPRTRAALASGATVGQCAGSGAPPPGLTSSSTPTQIESLRERLLELQRQLQLILAQ